MFTQIYFVKGFEIGYIKINVRKIDLFRDMQMLISWVTNAENKDDCT